MRSSPIGAPRRLALARSRAAMALSMDLKVSASVCFFRADIGIRNGRIAQMAMERGYRPDQLRQQLIQSGQIGAVVQQIREHKTIDAIIGKAKVEEMSADDFKKKFTKDD